MPFCSVFCLRDILNLSKLIQFYLILPALTYVAFDNYLHSIYFLNQRMVWYSPLGSLGPGSQGDMHPRACQCQILHIWGLYDHLDLVALQALAEKLKSTPSWCENDCLLLLAALYFWSIIANSNVQKLHDEVVSILLAKLYYTSFPWSLQFSIYNKMHNVCHYVVA